MKKKINIEYAWLTSFVEQVTDARYFEKEGCMIHSGRNILKIFSINGVSVVVKRYGRITLINRVLYALLRKSKAQRAYENAFILRRLGIDTPEAVAYVECRRGLVMTSCSLVTLYSDWQPLSSLHAYRYGDSDKEKLLDALTCWIASLHDKGVEHKDLNIGNILYAQDMSGGFRFMLLDINRMRFRQSMSINRRLKNLCRLSGNTDLTNYVLGRYAEMMRHDRDETVMRGVFYKVMFEMRQKLKRRIRKIYRHNGNRCVSAACDV